MDGLWATKSEGVGLIVRARFPTYVILIHQRHRRTDRRTVDMHYLNTALCTSASRGKNIIRLHVSMFNPVPVALGVDAMVHWWYTNVVIVFLLLLNIISLVIVIIIFVTMSVDCNFLTALLCKSVI